MSILFDFANGDDLAAKAQTSDQLILRVSTEEVSKGLIGDAVDRLSVLSDCKALTRKFKGKVWIYFDGYDNDRREIYQIPECVSFFRQVTDSWPYWYHFLEKQAEQMSLLHRLLCDVDVQVVSPHMVRCKFKDLGQLERVMYQLFGGLNHLYETHGFSEAEIFETTMDVQQSFEAFLS